MYYVYIIENEKKEKYIGYTKNLRKRLEEHNANRGARYTKNSKWDIVYIEGYRTQEQAMKRERSIKRSGAIRKALYERISM